MRPVHPRVLAVAVLLAPAAAADVFTTDAAPVAIPDLGAVTLDLVVDAAFSVTDVNAIVSIDHSRVGDLRVVLSSSDGTSVLLLAQGASGNQLLFTTFDDEAPQAIGAGSTPFAASFAPVASLSAFDGKPAAGTWTLRVEDVAPGSTGTLECFSLAFNGRTYVAEQLDAPILDFETAQVTVTVPGSFPVLDVEIGFDLSHSWVGDLSFYLSGPESIAPKLFQGQGSFTSGLSCVTLDDGAPTTLALSGSFGPGRFATDSGAALGSFAGDGADGVWRLSIYDGQFDDTGTLHSWWLHLTADQPPAVFDPCAVARLEAPLNAPFPVGAVSGERAAVGDSGEAIVGQGSGAVRVYAPLGGSWVQTAHVFPLSASGGDAFGYALDFDGQTLLVGAPGRDDAAGEAGAAFVFQENGGVWSEAAILVPAGGQPNARWGASVALDGATAILGHDGPFTGADDARVFQRIAGQWVETASLATADPAVPNDFGTQVALDAGRAVVGAPGDFGVPGAAYVFEFGPGGWQEVAKLTGSSALANDRFGDAVAIDGSVIAIGAFGDDSLTGQSNGAVYVFEQSTPGGPWVETAKLLPVDAVPFAYFGRDVSVAGDRIAAGTTNQREVQIFDRSATGWEFLVAVVEPVSPGVLQTDTIDLAPDRVIVSGGLGTANATILGLPSTQTLYTCEPAVSVSAGGTQTLHLGAGSALAGDIYLVAGSASGTAPGLVLPTATVPLVFDAYLLATLQLANTPPFGGTLGVLDALGRATATITLPPGSAPALAGLELNHAFVAIDPGTGALELVSAPVPLAVVP